MMKFTYFVLAFGNAYELFSEMSVEGALWNWGMDIAGYLLILINVANLGFPPIFEIFPIVDSLNQLIHFGFTNLPGGFS